MKTRVSRWIPVLALAGLLGAPTWADSDRLRVSLSAWPTEMSGIQQVNGDTVEGSATDFAGALGLDSEILPELHVDLKVLGPFHIVGSYFNSSFEGTQTLEESVTYDDVVYGIGEQVKSSMEVELGKVMTSFSVLSMKRIGLGVMVGLNLLSVKSYIESSLSGEAQKDVTAPYPVVGVNLRLSPLKKLNIYAELSGLSVNAGGLDARSIDGLVRLEYFIVPWIGITGGYRIVDLDASDDDFGALDFQQDGGQFGLVFRL
jgi:hypothetical protein